MKELEKTISNLVETQFPEFYQDEGPNFIQFIKAYYEWLEQSGNAVSATRNLMAYRDIDTTIPEFINYFKSEYLNQFPLITASSTQFMIKHIKDYYLSKGSKESLSLLFLLLFGTTADVYYPSEHILRADDGRWIIPEYLELEISDTSKLFIGELLYGSISGATAFAEGFIRKRVNGRFVDVVFISQRVGDFLNGELITNSVGNLINAPKIIGSLTNITITNGGSNNNIGDLFNISSAANNGIDGIARVVAVVDSTGRVTFTLVDGGSGYSNVAPHAANVYVSNTTAFYNNASASFTTLETVIQPLQSYPYQSLLGNTGFAVGTKVYGYSGATLKANGYVVSNTSSNTTSGNLVLSVISGDFSLATSLEISGNTVNAQASGPAAFINATGTYIGSNSTVIGFVNIVNKFYGNGAFIFGGTSNTFANIASIGTGNGASFNIGILSNEQLISILANNTIQQINAGNVYIVEYIAGYNPNNYPSVYLNGGNANVGGNALNNIIVINGGTLYQNTDTVVFSGGGQAGNPVVNATAVINTYSNGTIANVTITNIAADYYSFPNVAVASATGSGANLIANGYFALGFISNPTANLNSSISSIFSSESLNLGTIASLVNINPGNNYNLAPIVSVIQPEVFTYNLRDINISVSNTTGLTTPGSVLMQPQASGNTALAIIKSANSTIIKAKRASFLTDFLTNGTITYIKNSAGTIIGTTNVTGFTSDYTTAPMGDNAVIISNVIIANNVASELQILFSGYGYLNGDSLILTSNTNPIEITGTANVINQGIGLGYWDGTYGLIDSDQYIHDNFVYQEFSYVVQAGMSIDKYANILKDLFHPAGFNMSGEVIKISEQPTTLNSHSSQIEIYP